MRTALLLAFAAAAAVAASASRAEGWQTYRNDRFGATADIPSDWRMEPPPENDDGRIFVSPDGRAKIVVSGSHVVLPRDEEFRIRLEPGEGETVSYRRQGRDWLVISGVDGDRIFYRKSVLSCRGEVWNSVSIDYPAAERKTYDALVAHVAGSLRGGAGYGIDKKCK